MNQNRKKGDHLLNAPIFTIPPYKVKRVLLAAAETIDWGLEMLSIPSLWRLSKGKDIKVAVLDSGIVNHPELSEAILDTEDFTNSSNGSYDSNGHGTHVAGIIAARKNNGGVVGVAPESQLLIGKVLGDGGNGSPKQLADGIKWAIEKEADIINISLTSSLEVGEVSEAIEEAVNNKIFVICAAGNSGPFLDSVEYPAKYPNTVAVGAIDREKKVAQFSARGPQVDIVAPGDNIRSTYPPGTFAVISGTSMAAPFASGIAALMLAKHRDYGGETPVENQEQLIEHFRKTAIDLGELGPDSLYGFGLINPEGLLYSQAARLLELIMKEDLTESGIKKLMEFANCKLTPTYNKEIYFEGSLKDGVGAIMGGIRIDL